MENVEVWLPDAVVDFLSEIGALSGLDAGKVAAVLLALSIRKEGSVQAVEAAEGAD